MSRLSSVLGVWFVIGALVGCGSGGESGAKASGTGNGAAAADASKAAADAPQVVAAAPKVPAKAPKAEVDASADWAQFRGPAGGVASAKGLPATFSQTENVIYKKELPGAGTSSPIIIGSRIYLTYYTGFNVPRQAGKMDDLKLHLLCLNKADGKQIWSTEVAPRLPEQARIRDDHGYASSTPACDGESLYVFFGKSGVFAFDLDGKQRWRADVGSGLNGWGSAASPLLFENLVIINASVESQSLVAFDKKTGKEVWKAGNIREAWNTPILVPVKGGKTELAIGVQGKVLGFDPATGQQLWSCNNDIGWYIVPTMVSADGVVKPVVTVFRPAKETLDADELPRPTLESRSAMIQERNAQIRFGHRPDPCGWSGLRTSENRLKIPDFFSDLLAIRGIRGKANAAYQLAPVFQRQGVALVSNEVVPQAVAAPS